MYLSPTIFGWDTFFRFHKKNEKGKDKVVFQGEDNIQKVVVQLPYTWGNVDSINRIRRSKLKGNIVVEVRGNQKATVHLTSIDQPQIGGKFTATPGGLTNLFYGCID